jgi:hypothetical protein
MIRHNLLVLGSQNAKAEDQKLQRPEIRPVQILHKNGTLTAIDFFNDWGTVGVSSMTWHDDFQDEIFISTNDNIYRFHLGNQQFEALPLQNINDIHDINFIGETLWISNTEYDEIIEYDPGNNAILQRRSLDPFRRQLDSKDSQAYKKVKDRFHCNQVFTSYDGDLCVLIHHVSGWQFYKIVLEKLVKKQGDGGIINLDKHKVEWLRLQSPHSVRKIDGLYWIQDSGDLSIKIFDRNWQPVDRVHVDGFGRGVDFSVAENRVYVGLSATRKRYLKVIPTGSYLSNRIQVLDLKERKSLGEIQIPNIEQLDNIYILNDDMYSKFLKL